MATTAQLASKRAQQQEKTTVLQPERVFVFVGNSGWLVFGVTLKTGVASELLQENKANQLQLGSVDGTTTNSAAKTLLNIHEEIS